jgi:hypothetical protein
MAIQEIHTFPQFSQFTLTMQMGPTKLTLRMTWRDRTKSWYLDIFQIDGTPLVLGRRLSPYWSPIFGDARTPELIDGSIAVRGLDGYEQDDLGTTSLLLWYIPFSDLLLLAPDEVDPLEPTITITSP